jgi:hypothetical protein
VRREVARFIDRYNTTHRHSNCEMRSPVDYEQIPLPGQPRRGRPREPSSRIASKAREHGR